MDKPTYTANEIKAMCQSMELDYEGFKVLADLIDEEIELYADEEIITIMQASLIVFSRSMLRLSLKML